jgi:hypothetical protein
MDPTFYRVVNLEIIKYHPATFVWTVNNGEYIYALHAN